MARRFLQFMYALLVVFAPSNLHAADTLQWSGFADFRGTTAPDGLPLRSDSVSAQAQLGIDWRPSVFFDAHVHLLARTEDDDSKRGHAGVVEAFLQQKADGFRFKEGAFFLPTSRENVDELWETPYSITPSALNSWMGEELRPIGVDASYTEHGFLAGASVFRGNDTFGALPASRGWDLRDHWATLGEHLPVSDGYYSSVSAETDHRLGWSTRARWNNDHATFQVTHIDNRSDAEDHGELFNWATRFDLAGADYTVNDWTLAAESGWGMTTIRFLGVPYPTDIRASYALLSRRFERARVTLRVESFQSAAIHQHAVTAAFVWSPLPKLRAGFEATKAGAERRVIAELRYRFSR
ncbi:MAG TPA: hypothetical protein VGR95_23570 [Thermoanaerobaculia bacterium]|jgi:hypothetical protein|nr:hypothetical protein [Thermoanaerobaculia bacterium]